MQLFSQHLPRAVPLVAVVVLSAAGLLGLLAWQLSPDRQRYAAQHRWAARSFDA
jgi:Tfp pilus assembly protein PilV